jgi:hypothetical protein
MSIQCCLLLIILAPLFEHCMMGVGWLRTCRWCVIITTARQRMTGLEGHCWSQSSDLVLPQQLCHRDLSVRRSWLWTPKMEWSAEETQLGSQQWTHTHMHAKTSTLRAQHQSNQSNPGSSRDEAPPADEKLHVLTLLICIFCSVIIYGLINYPH